MSIPRRQTVNNDYRWLWVDLISDALSVLVGIETHRRFIRTHATNADMYNVALNLRQIIKEADGMAREIEKIKARLAGIQGELIRAIYQINSDEVVVKLNEGPGSADAEVGWTITDGKLGRRCRRVRFSDYTSKEVSIETMTNGKS